MFSKYLFFYITCEPVSDIIKNAMLEIYTFIAIDW